MKEDILFEINYLSLKVDNFKKKKQQLLDMLKDYPDYRKVNQNFFTNRQTDRSGMAEKFKKICAKEFATFNEKTKKHMIIEDIWSVRYGQGDFHPIHNHGSVGLTGILYLQTDKEDSTVYVQPWNDHLTDMTGYHKLRVDEGTMVITPRFVNHFTNPHQSTRDRIVIAFDITV